MCSSNCTKCTNNIHCTTCALGYYLVNSANPSCSACPNNCNYCANGTYCNWCIDTTNYIFINTANSISCATII
jgi:hypothetical protein